MELEGELFNFIKVWIMIFISLSYSYSVGKLIKPGVTRLFLLLPIICVFLVLPLDLSSMHLGGMTAFFIAWLANFKLLLYAFGQGPLSSNPPISLVQFIPLACFPIKIQEKYHSDGKNEENPSRIYENKEYPVLRNWQKSFPNFALLKCIVSVMLIRFYGYRELLHQKVILVLYCVHMYIFLELVLAVLGFLAQAIMGFELEPQFNEPYLSSSLQDFWGKRWNIMVTSILRSTVYEPLLRLLRPTLGRRWASLPAIMGTFIVSGFMHELIFYYLGRVKPSWEITLFFLLHGVCLVFEVVLKKVINGRFVLPTWISAPLTVGFVLVTSFWLFFPTFFRCKGDRGFDEYAALGEFLRKWWRVFL